MYISSRKTDFSSRYRKASSSWKAAYTVWPKSLLVGCRNVGLSVVDGGRLCFLSTKGRALCLVRFHTSVKIHGQTFFGKAFSWTVQTLFYACMGPPS